MSGAADPGPGPGFTRLLAALDRLSIPYMVCGSMASSVHGLPRTTRDVDFVVALSAGDAARLTGELRPDFYVEEQDLERSLATGRACNGIHLSTSYKFALFPLAATQFDQMQFSRREWVALEMAGSVLRFPAATPEDTILAKLRWYKMGGGVSDLQWADLTGIVRSGRQRLDPDYLRRWAEDLGLEYLLERLLTAG